MDDQADWQTMTWFEELMGFPEKPYGQVHEFSRVEGWELVSLVTHKRYRIGEFATPTLAELRAKTAKTSDPIKSSSPGTLRETVGNVQTLHQLKENEGALFQVASQFNVLEMVGPSITPEQGVGMYQFDRTQGPACAIAAGAATIYRNYWVPLEDQFGQTAERQIDCLSKIAKCLSDEPLWEMTNGYAFPTGKSLAHIDAILAEKSAEEIDQIRAALKIGTHASAEVTINECGQLVSQVFGSALPISYAGRLPIQNWERFARLVLEASYEACLRVGLLNHQTTGNNRVFLTLLGGGAFGNPEPWIYDAIRYALTTVEGANSLDLHVVSYGMPNPSLHAHFST